VRRTTRFRQLVAAPEILVLPGAHDALSLRLIERAGFAAATCGGFATTATLLGAPDIGQLTMTEMAENYARLCDSTELPIFADGDTGHGNVSNVARTVRSFERAGVAGLFIEDQVAPKRCGHMEGKAVIPAVEMVAKLHAALDARTDPDLVIMARTDALAVTGIDDALERAHAYRAAGADMIFIEAPTSLDEMRRVAHATDAPAFANMVEGGKTPILDASALQQLGFAVVAYPVGATFLIARALEAYYGTLRRDGNSAALADRLMSFADFSALVGLPAMRQKERDWTSRG
jgi:methylisocitrate lyase